MACDANQIRAALFEQTQIVNEFVDEKIRRSDRTAMRMIPDKGSVERNANNDVVIMGTAKQAPMAYRSQNNAVRNLVAGDMNGRTLAGTNGLFDVNINDIDDNACHGGAVLDFSQGYKRRGTADYELAVESQIICTRELQRMDKARIRGYFRGLRDNFTQWGFDNFSENLDNLVIQNSEANSSIVDTAFNWSTGGWVAPPAYRLSIFHLQEWKRHIGIEMATKGWDVPPNWMFEVEAPVEDWIEAVAADQIARDPTGTRYNIQYLKDAEGPMRGRTYDTYGGIKCYFNEKPKRGYFKRTSSGGFSFVRVYDWKNEVDEVGGLRMVANAEYQQDKIIVDGVVYEMVTLVPHIDRRSFQRFSLGKPVKPEGDANLGTNYTVEVRDGAYIDCNKHNDKFQLVARHEFRLRNLHPEVSGYLAYRHSLRAGYTVAVTSRDPIFEGTATAGNQQLPVHGPDACSTAGCAQCGQVPNDSLQCVDEDAAPHGTLNLNPCGTLASSFFGDAYDIVLRVHRTGDPSSYASVLWASAHVTTDDSDFLDTSGNLLEWQPGDTDPKEIVIPILATFTEAVADTADQFTVTISGAVGDALGTCTVATINISDLS